MAVSIATVILYWRSKRYSALVMVVGIASIWLSLGLLHFGPKTEVHVPRAELDSTIEWPEDKSRGEIVPYLVLDKPMAIVAPMMIVGSGLFAVGFLVFSWGSRRKIDNKQIIKGGRA